MEQTPLRPRLSDPQKEVAALDAPQLAIVAAAGSGKTRVLEERYIRHVTQEGISPEQILAISFTRKAAAEIRERVVKRLNEEGNPDAGRQAETGPIVTIDAWLQAMLRACALESGLDPEFELLDDHSFDRMFVGAFREEIATAQHDDPMVTNLTSKLAGESAKRRRTDPETKVQQWVKDWLYGARASGISSEEYERTYASVASLQEAFLKVVLGSAPASVAEHHVPGPSVAEALKSAYKAAGHRCPAWVKSAPPEPEHAELELAVGLAHLATKVWARVRGKMLQDQRFDLTELLQIAVQLVETNEAVRVRLRHAYPIVMIDEAQDVNPLQYRLLKGIGFPQITWIGDPQQSIYGFRDADVEQFLETAREGVEKNLGVNHRTADSIQHFIDQSCAGWWSNPASYRALNPREFQLDVTAVPRIPNVEIWDFTQNDTHALARMIRDFGVRQRDRNPEFRWGEVMVLTHQNAYASDLERALAAQDVPGRTVGGSKRLYTRLEVRDVANVLRAVADPTDDYSLLCTLRGPLVSLSLDSIALLSASSPVSEALATFEPPEEDRSRLAEFMTWYPRLLSYADRLPAVDVLSHLFADTPLLERIAAQANGDQAVANVRKVLLRASESLDVGPLEFAEMIRDIQDFSDPGLEAETADLGRDELSIMTIHKSKGTESNVVIVTESFVKVKSRLNEVEFHRLTGLACPKLRAASLLYNWASADRADRELAEKQRLMYVAMTRARKRLVVMASSRKDHQTIASLVARGLGSPSEWEKLVEVYRPGEPPESGAK